MFEIDLPAHLGRVVVVSPIACSHELPRDCGPKLMMKTAMMIPNSTVISSDREFFRIWSSMAGRNLTTIGRRALSDSARV